LWCSLSWNLELHTPSLVESAIARFMDWMDRV
jgi:hypothetical protein